MNRLKQPKRDKHSIFINSQPTSPIHHPLLSPQIIVTKKKKLGRQRKLWRMDRKKEKEGERKKLKYTSSAPHFPCLFPSFHLSPLAPFPRYLSPLINSSKFLFLLALSLAQIKSIRPLPFLACILLVIVYKHNLTPLFSDEESVAYTFLYVWLL